MSIENAKENLKEFGKELKLEGLVFDENNTCILGIDDKFSLHLTFEPNSDRLYLYSPLLDGLPRDDKTKLKLYERLLEGSMLGGQMAGGGVGVAVKEELILMHCTLDMKNAQGADLCKFAPLYVETVEKWRETCSQICEGRAPAEDKKNLPPPPQSNKPGQGFIKI
jgi:Tir chaperone protein (CesT) family